MGASTAAQSEREIAPLSWAPHLGPAKVLYLCDPYCDLKAIAVLDNPALEPAIVEVRMVPDRTFSEVFHLARPMTLKNAAALPRGGENTGIISDPFSSNRDALIRSFARGIAELSDTFPELDTCIDESCMAVETGPAARGWES